MLFILVEGPDDDRFFTHAIEPLLNKRYESVRIVVLHAGYTSKRLRSFLSSIRAMRADYFYVADVNDAPCVTAKKDEIVNTVQCIDKGRILVVTKEIESWYLAGLPDHKCRELGIPVFGTTDDIDKEQFNRICGARSRIHLMSEILKSFTFEVAKRKNSSLRYFLEKQNW